jgi:hypothetical protein
MIANGIALVQFSVRADFVIGGRQIVLEAAHSLTVHKRCPALVSGILTGATKHDLLDSIEGFRPVDARVAQANYLEGRGYGFAKFVSLNVDGECREKGGEVVRRR